MIRIRRLNLDTSWYLDFNGTRFLIDPWLLGSEVDGFSWFNEQWHIKEPVAPDRLPVYDHILISQSYEDHCHINTLKELGSKCSYIASGKAYKRIEKEINPDQLKVLPEYPTQPLDIGGVQVLSLHPGRKLDPIYYAVIFESKGEAILYASHGFHLSESLAAELSARFDFSLLITTFTYFRLPGFMGGAVNPGVENALDLVRKIKPKYVANTHDEKKKGRGIVSKLAKVKYPEFEVIDFPENTEFIGIYDYEEVVL